MLITGDDILIEYCERLMSALKSVNETLLKVSWRSCLEKFISHKVWHNSEKNDNSMKLTLWGKLETRLDEMKDRRKRLVKIIYKKEGRLSDFEHGYKT